MTPSRPIWRALSIVWIAVVTVGYLHGIAQRLGAHLPH
jgi:hypothetical protein